MHNMFELNTPKMSVKEARKTLGDDGVNLSDEDVERLINLLTLVAELEIKYRLVKLEEERKT